MCTSVNYIIVVFSPQSLQNSEAAYEKAVIDYSIKNQLRYRGNVGAFSKDMILRILLIF